MNLALDDDFFCDDAFFLVFLREYAAEIDTVPVLCILSRIECSMNDLHFLFFLLSLFFLGIFLLCLIFIAFLCSGIIWLKINIILSFWSFYFYFIVGLDI